MNDIPYLKHVARDPQLPWQWHTDEAWRCEISGRRETYLAGFPTREAAEAYGHRRGWLPAQRCTDKECKICAA